MAADKRVIALILLSLFGSCSRAEAPLQVVASIKPLQLLALAVGGSEVRADVLLDPAASPHDYQLRPSDRARLAAADAVFWVGPRLEHFMQPALKVLPKNSVEVALDDGAADPHIWLDPVTMRGVALRMADTYAVLRPARKEFFFANAARIDADLAREDRSLRALFEAAAPSGFIVEHDAYQRFEARYGLKHRAAVTDSSDLPPSVATMLRIRSLLDSGEIGCVLAEAQESTQLRALLDGRTVRLVRLDPLAAKVSTSAGGLLDFYRQLGKSISECLKR